MQVKRGKNVLAALLAVPAIKQLVFKVAQQAKHSDLIFANSQKSFIVAALAGLVAKRPVVWCLHDILSSDHFGTLNIKVGVTLANLFAAKVIANSEATAQSFTARGGKASLVSVVHNGISAEPYDAVRPQEVAATRAVLGLSDKPVVGVFSRLSPWKGQHVLLEALRDLPDVQAVIVGEALFGEEAYAGKLKQLVQDFGLSKRVHFLGFRPDIATLMKTVDIVVHTSVAPEPFGRVVVEGMLSRKPVIASKAGGVLEIIEDGRSGLLVEPGNSRGLKTALQSVLEDKALAQTLSDEAHKRATTAFSLDTMIRGVNQVLANVLLDKTSRVSETSRAEINRAEINRANRVQSPLVNEQLGSSQSERG
jgi:glycosyltransferase involved in cell wall biosynthesis